ncbi:methylmalonyl-CoA mutase [Paraburkholderia sp. SARCC-3016]|uniref:methylmalonyl-CoA mutase n=1 Tax=Paraburkholderia sp. SARCC-3016 TaxID=3058611 RepID=UPI0028097957|nr:methylmalonyl-CoA mutase [Paraburkholderia sp. SARCC-3016]MDQ7976889.1 methylmalonyl-CoA mutase [Paraburkholderia sp. SARCC-3016]
MKRSFGRRRRRAVTLKPLYTRADTEGLAHLDSLPGEAPFVRGPYASMYTGRRWTIRQYAGYAQAADTNLAFRTALAEGAQGLSVAFDLPTQRGYDSDDPQVAADVGVTGVAIDTVEDMARLFADIALVRTSVSMTMNGAVLPVLAAFIVAAEERGVAAAQLTGTIQNDILKEFITRNTCIFAPEPSLRIAADVVEYLASHAPRFHALSVSGYHFQEAGADPVLELALTMADARAYVRTLVERGMGADDVCEHISFFFGVGTDFYAEIAKLRAARLVWSALAAQCGARSDRARALRMHCQTSGWSLTAQKPLNNVVRTTVEALAAVFGGTQSLHTNAYDEALALPCAASARVARDTQLVLQHETGICDVIDPWAGSYMMESLTADIAARVHALLDEIDGEGGIVGAIRSGWVRERLDRCALEVQAQIESGERAIVGVNGYRQEDDAPDESGAARGPGLDAAQVARHQALRIADVKAKRDIARVGAALRALERAARDGDGNLLALTIDCMRARATVGECTRALEAVWPRHTVALQVGAGVYRDALSDDPAWRAACDAVARVSAAFGRRPRVLMTKLGQDGHDRGARVVAAALTDAGFDVVASPLFAPAADVCSQAIAARADVIGVSSLSGAHGALVLELLEQLRIRGAAMPVVVGGNLDGESTRLLQAAGVAACFPVGSSVSDIVSGLARISGHLDPARLHDVRTASLP